MKKKPKKCSLRNEKLKANRASETEEQRKERLRIRHEKDRARMRTKKVQEEKKRSSETEDHQEQRLATLKRLKRGDENELERKLRLEKVVASKHFRLAVEKKEEQDWRMMPYISVFSPGPFSVSVRITIVSGSADIP